MSSAWPPGCAANESTVIVKVAPLDYKIKIECDVNRQCTNKVEASISIPVGRIACVELDGVGHSVELTEAVASEQNSRIKLCSPILDRDHRHDMFDAVFISDNVLAAWTKESGTISTFDFCEGKDVTTALCTSTEESKGLGALQVCGQRCNFVLLAQKNDSTCGSNEERRFYQGVCAGDNKQVYTMYELAFAPFTFASKAMINGRSLSQGQEAKDYYSLRVTTDLPNPFTGMTVAVNVVDFNEAFVGGAELLSSTNCRGFCGFTMNSNNRFSIQGQCIHPNANCADTSVPGCKGIVDYTTPNMGSPLPYTLADHSGTLRCNGSCLQPYAYVPGSAIALRGIWSFSVPNRERIAGGPAATNLIRLEAVVVPLDASFQDVLLISSNGAVTTSSKTCVFTLLDTRENGNRAYSILNHHRLTKCDLIISNGDAQRTIIVDVQPKDSTATVIADSASVWNMEGATFAEHNETSNLDPVLVVGLGLGLGLGIPLLVTIAIFIWSFVCMKKEDERPDKRESERTTSSLNTTGTGLVNNPLNLPV